MLNHFGTDSKALDLKLAVVSNTGNAGKTTIATYLLYPRLPGADFLAVETINQSAKDIGVTSAALFKGHEFGALLEEITLAPGSVVVDVGASNVEALFTAMLNYKGATEEFDRYIVPVVPDQKSVTEALRTVRELRAVGISRNRIRVLPNRVTGDPARDLGELYKRLDTEGLAWYEPSVFIPESELFPHLASHRMSFADLLDGKDYRAMARAEPDRDKAREYAGRYRWGRVAENLQETMDRVFERLIS